MLSACRNKTTAGSPCCIAVVVLLDVLGNRTDVSILSLFALVAVLLALACSVNFRFWREGRKRVRDTEREFEAVFEHALDAILILDDEGVCVDADPAAFAILGAPRSVLIGHSFAQFHEDRQQPNGKGRKAKTAKITSWSIRAGVVRKLDRGEPEPDSPNSALGAAGQAPEPSGEIPY